MATTYKSISVNKKERLIVNFVADWSSDNANVTVDDGWIYATKDVLFPNGKATITATEKGGSRSEIFKVTIVPWSANQITVEEKEVLASPYIITKHGNKLYASVKMFGLELFESTDGMKTMTKVCNLPESQLNPPMLITPYGYFIRNIYSIKKSTNLQTWTNCITLPNNTSPLVHMFDYYFDVANSKVYIYTVEYQTGNTSHRSKIYRGTISANGTELWETVFEFASRDEVALNPELIGCWHEHFIIVDKATGHVYMGVGDTDNESRIMRSTDNGTTWTTLGHGSQEWRALSMWFTEKYIYWAMDSGHVEQKIFRIPRIWLSTKTTAQINTDKQTVAVLSQGSLWYHIWGKDDKGNDVIFLTQAAEGSRRDYNGRMYMIRELLNGSVELDEIMIFPSTTPDTYSAYLQVEPQVQDSEGYIYLNGRGTTVTATRKFKLVRRGRKLVYKFASPKFLTR